MVDVTLLGTGGTTPLPNRWLTALQIRYRGKTILIDAGEGTQITLKQLGWKPKSVEAIFLTHFHGDHVIGLPGLLFAIANGQRVDPITIYGPEGLTNLLEGMRVIVPYLPYEIEIIELPDAEISSFSLMNGDIEIKALPVDHTIPCMAYAFEIKRSRRFNREKAEKNKVPKQLWSKLQKEKDILLDGKIYTPEMVLGRGRKGIKVSYCTDTRPIKELVDFIRYSDLFIGEGMYGSQDDLQKAIEHKHMLFSEAAELAKDGEVKELWLTHFSPSLPGPEQYLNVAAAIFANTVVGEDRLQTTITFDE